MKKKRIFIFEPEGLPAQYGIGKYLNILREEAYNFKKYQFIFIKRNNEFRELRLTQSEHLTFVSIPFPERVRLRLNHISSFGIYCLLNERFHINHGDTIHINDSVHFPIVKILKKNTDCKIVYTIHVSLWQIFYGGNYDKFSVEWSQRTNATTNEALKLIQDEAEVCRMADSVITLNNETNDFINSHYNLDIKKVTLIRNGIPISKQKKNNKALESLREELGIEKNSKVLLYVGRIDEGKGVPYLIKAFRNIVKTNSNMRLLLVGHGDINGMFEYIYGYWKYITFTGYILPDLVTNFYKISDIVISPSTSEQGSYTILEAIALKKPLIITDIPAFDFLESDFSSLKINEKISTNTLEYLITKLIGDDMLRKYLANNAYNTLIENFTSNKMFNNLLAVYEKNYQ